MYLKHYQLALMPFSIGPDPKFLWLGSKHEKAYAILKYGIRESKGLVVITGEPGTGKSTVLNAIIAEFATDVRFAKIIDPALGDLDFFNLIGNAFEMGRTFRSKAEFLSEYKSLIKEAGSKKMVLVIDEAQRLSLEMLEQIRVLANAEEPGQKVLSCIFAGQPEFLVTLNNNRMMRQRIFFSHIIEPLSQSETEEYIAHRLKVAGRRAPIFNAAAVEEVFRLSGGIPRLINIACDKALLIGYAVNKKKIGPDIVREGAQNTLIPMTTSNAPGAGAKQIEPESGSLPIHAAAAIQRNAASKKPAVNPAGRVAAYFLAIAILVAGGLSAYYYLNGGFGGLRISPANETAQDVGRAQTAGSGADDAQAPKAKILELRRQKDEDDARLKEMQERVGSLENELKALREAKDRTAGFERALAWKDAAIAQLTHMLESIGPNQAIELQKELESIKKENRRLQARLSAVTDQNSAAEASSGGEQKLSPELSAYLKSTHEKVARLETEMSAQKKQLALLEQESNDLEKSLAKEKAARKQIDAELSSRQAAVVALQQKLDAAESVRLKLEVEVQAARNDNARLKAQLQALKARRESPSAPGTPQMQTAAPAAPDSSASPDTVPDPASVIDYVIKKKSR